MRSHFPWRTVIAQLQADGYTGHFCYSSNAKIVIALCSSISDSLLSAQTLTAQSNGQPDSYCYKICIQMCFSASDI